MAFPTVSVIIPVRNEAKRIRQCIEGILKQTVPVQEIIVIDSGSTDGTLDILADFPMVDVIEIDGSTFNHGLTRNLGVERATGEFCQLTVGDAYAYNEFWLEEMLKGFVDDEVRAVCGQQVVDHLPENNPLQWFRPVDPISEIKRLQFSPREWSFKSKQEQRDASRWDDVNAMYRKSAMETMPFEETGYSEDLIWANNALKQGWALSQNHNARVYHFHFETKEFRFKRTLTTSYFIYKLHGVLTELPKRKKITAHLIDFLRLVKLTKSPLKAAQWLRYNIRSYTGYYNAINLAHTALKTGEKEFDQQHQLHCAKPPIPPKSK